MTLCFFFEKKKKQGSADTRVSVRMEGENCAVGCATYRRQTVTVSFPLYRVVRRCIDSLVFRFIRLVRLDRNDFHVVAHQATKGPGETGLLRRVVD